jgi:hypothetical protein
MRPESNLGELSPGMGSEHSFLRTGKSKTFLILGLPYVEMIWQMDAGSGRP